MRPSLDRFILIRLQEAFDRIDADLERTQAPLNNKEVQEAFNRWAAARREGTPSEVELKPHSRRHPPIPSLSIEAAYPWRHIAARAAKDLRDCGWIKEGEVIAEVLSKLPTAPVDGNQPDNMARDFDTIRAGAEQIKMILSDCLAGGPSPQGGKSDDGGTVDPQGDQGEKPKPNDEEPAAGQAAGGTAAEKPAGPGQGQISSDVEALPKRPSDNAFRAWFVRATLSITKQADIAEEMTRQGVPATQGQVSKWLAQVEEYRTSGGVMPGPASLGKVQSVDPEILEMGVRQDGLTPRQRARRDPDAE